MPGPRGAGQGDHRRPLFDGAWWPRPKWSPSGNHAAAPVMGPEYGIFLLIPPLVSGRRNVVPQPDIAEEEQAPAIVLQVRGAARG
eukprot:7524600-Lingulodinium_polyedra.AAC.1